MTLYTDDGGGPGKRADGTYDHYRPFRRWGVIERETPAYWFVREPGATKLRRINRANPYTPGLFRVYLYTEDQVHEMVWRRTYALRISSAASRADTDTLKRIAAVLGMDCPQPERTP